MLLMMLLLLLLQLMQLLLWLLLDVVATGIGAAATITFAVVVVVDDAGACNTSTSEIWHIQTLNPQLVVAVVVAIAAVAPGRNPAGRNQQTGQWARHTHIKSAHSTNLGHFIFSMRALAQYCGLVRWLIGSCGGTVFVV
jgi:hypothetical protein